LECREHALPNLPVDVSSIGGGRGKRVPEGLQMRAEHKVVVLLARESRQVEDDHELDSALVLAAELQQLLELGAVGGFRALAFLAESREHVEALALQYSSQAFSCVGRLRFSVGSLVLTRT